MTLLQTPAEARSASVLGRAVHPAALRRLHELFPDAHVTVRHESTPVDLPMGSMKLSRRTYHNPEHETRVIIDLDGDGNPSRTIFGKSICHPEDNFDRRRGVELAFRRVLDIARDVYHRRQQEKAYREPTTAPGLRGPGGSRFA